MRSSIYRLLFSLTVLLLVVGCEEEYELGKLVQSNFEEGLLENDPNRVVLLAKNDGAALNKWYISTGQILTGDSVVAYLPFEGTYTITHKAFSQGGATSTERQVVITQTDPAICQVENLRLLTGGCDQPNGKTWVLDSLTFAHFGLGPNTASYPDWYQAQVNEKAGLGFYDDEYTFRLVNFQAEFDYNGDILIRANQAENFPNVDVLNEFDGTAFLDNFEGTSYSLDEDGDKLNLTINGGATIGYFTGTNSYEIIELSENLMILKYFDTKDPAFAWFVRLVPADFTPPPPATSKMPIDFESPTAFGTFNGAAFSVIDNPQSGGINTSAKVGEYIKGAQNQYAGIATLLEQPLDFSSQSIMRMKVYAPIANRVLLKLEQSTDANNNIERFATITESETNQWVDLSFDMDGVQAGVYDNLVVFMDVDNQADNTYYIDDIRQEAAPAVLTLDVLTGGGSKTWMLKPAAGSFGVGPDKGGDGWWPQGADISGDRPCLFNDQYIFKSGGEYEYNAQGDVFAESYMGLADGCYNETELTGDAAIWQSGTHSFSFTPATASDPAYITVTGLGAFIALPKAYNGGEYTAPPTASSSVTYEVLEYSKTSTAETIKISVNIAGGFWTFVIESK